MEIYERSLPNALLLLDITDTYNIQKGVEARQTAAKQSGWNNLFNTWALANSSAGALNPYFNAGKK